MPQPTIITAVRRSSARGWRRRHDKQPRQAPAGTLTTGSSGLPRRRSFQASQRTAWGTWAAAAMWIAQTVRYLTDGTLPKIIGQSGIHASIVFALDLSLIVPAFLIGAVLLWRGHPAGVVSGVAMNVLGCCTRRRWRAAGGFQAHAGISGTSWAGPPWIELAITSLAACWLLLLHYLTTGASTRGAAGTHPQLIPGGSHRRPREEVA